MKEFAQVKTLVRALEMKKRRLKSFFVSAQGPLIANLPTRLENPLCMLRLLF